MTIDHTHDGIGISPLFYPSYTVESVKKLYQTVIVIPLSEMVVDCCWAGEVCGEHSPLAPSFYQICDSLEYLDQIDFFSVVVLGQKLFNKFPLAFINLYELHDRLIV